MAKKTGSRVVKCGRCNGTGRDPSFPNLNLPCIDCVGGWIRVR